MKASETSVLKFVGGLDKVFIIPPFQRNYEWSEKECRALFDDIITSAVTKKSHYLGNVVYYVGENDGASYSEYILVDGQQRITTILLILCALRDIFKETDNEADAGSIDRRYLKNDTSDNKFRVRLKQTNHDLKSFSSIVDGVETKEDTKVVQNFNLFKQLIKESSVSPKKIYEAIPRLEMVDVNLQITNDLRAVQTVFEKINSTGKPLEPADLIRNFLLLATSSKEQQDLYDNYWVNIERELSTDNISRFARDYLIMKIFEDVPNDKIYSMFKEHFQQENIAHETILSDMYKYSKYYAWLKFYNCPLEKINKKLEYLNFYKSDDLYPLYLFLLEKLYSTNTDELLKILSLLVDFVTRYRIVSPSGGGGALRAAIQQLLESLSTGAIEATYDNILFELSNSPTPASRFPDDAEFEKVLIDRVNPTYARALLLQIEEHEKFNIPVELSKVTIEHLMPQTLTQWWIDYLGGEDEASRIYDAYLNSIGNLAPISQSYNTKNSNKPWPSKVPNLRDVQFNITSEVADNEEWKEKDIIKRANDVAQRASKAVTSPLPRTRKYQTKDASDEFTPGLYPLSDLETPMEGANMQALVFDGDTYNVGTFRDLFCKVCLIALKHDNEKFDSIAKSNLIHKSTSTNVEGVKDPIIGFEPSRFVSPIRLEDTKYYLEGALSSKRVRVYSKQLLEQFDDLLSKAYIMLE